MTTILDVEKKSGVSRSTISRHLNGKNIDKANKIKVEQAIKELSYQRNPIASGLKSKRTYTVGCVVPDITHPFFPMIIKNFQKYMETNGYQTILNSYNNDLDLEIAQVKTLANRVDGLVVVTGSRDGLHIRECLNEKLPVVLLDRMIEGFECDSVLVDNYHATYDAISLAIRKGHTRMGYIRVSDLYSENLRFDGFKDALTNNGIKIEEKYIVRADLIEHDATRQFMRLMNMPIPPTLIFCSNVYIAMGALEAMIEYNLNIPKDVSVMTFDRLSSLPYYGFTRCIKPEFTYISQPLEDLGIKTAETLLMRINNGMDNYKPISIELKTSFFLTESVADVNS